jgi:hypothetical protein
MSTRSKKSTKRQKSARSAMVRAARFGPPQFSSNVTNRHSFRFTATASSSASISANNLLGIVGNICHVANTAVMSIAGSAKLHRVSIYTPPAAQGASATCQVTWLSATADSPSLLEMSDTSVSTAQPAHISTVPPKESGAAFWFNSSTDPLFQIVAPIGSIIDVDISYVLNDIGAPGVAATVVTGTLGVMYWLPLDGTSSHNLTPVSLLSTF